MHVINCILQGLLTGAILSIMLGTVFFSLIKNSLSSGFKTGVYIAIGVILCDVIFITLAILSTEFANFLEEDAANSGQPVINCTRIYVTPS